LKHNASPQRQRKTDWSASLWKVFVIKKLTVNYVAEKYISVKNGKHILADIEKNARIAIRQ